MIKVGLVGIGYWGPNLARVLSQYPGCDLTAACDLRPESLAWMRRQYPSVKGYLDWDEFLASDVDAVVIATPISTHYGLARRALLAGKHVFVEKPLAHTAQLAHQLVALAAAQKRILFTGHTFIYSPPVV